MYYRPINKGIRVRFLIAHLAFLFAKHLHARRFPSSSPLYGLVSHHYLGALPLFGSGVWSPLRTLSLCIRHVYVLSCIDPVQAYGHPNSQSLTLSKRCHTAIQFGYCSPLHSAGTMQGKAYISKAQQNTYAKCRRQPN